MKKSKKFLILAAGAVSLLSLAGCNDVTARGNVIISFRDANGSYVKYTADDLFSEYTKSAQDSVESYYSAIYDVLVREWFNLSENANIKKECDDAADITMEAKKTEAENAADSNNTTYDEEWENILNSTLTEIAEDKRDDDQLLAHLQLEEYKERIEDEFYDKFKTWKKENVTEEEQSNNLFWGDEGYLKEQLPYHVRHILVNVSASENQYYNGTIASNEVYKLYNVVNELSKGTDFGTIAKDQSDDSGSATLFGDLGIMDKSTSYVNEFKLGIYAYETFFSTQEEVESSLSTNDNPFNIPEEDGEYIKSLGIASIPFEAIVKMNELKYTTLDNNNKEVNDGDQNYYPRNILFNKYFNNHNLAFITPDSISGTDPVKVNDGDKLNSYYTDLNTDGTWSNGIQNETYAQLQGFKEIKLKKYDSNGKFNGYETRKVLCDNNGNPIIVVRAGSGYQGIHFISITRSPLVEEATVTTNDETYTVPLNEYYASETPLTSSSSVNTNFPTTANGTQKKTYVSTFVSNYDTYNSRVETIKNKVESFDSNYEYRIYSWLKSKLNVKYNDINGINMGDRIETFIDEKKNIAEFDQRESNITTWDSFIDLLKVQQSQRKTKLIPETCALHFKEGYKNNANKTVVEACYNEK